MLALAHHYDEPVASASGVYRARVYGRVLEDGRWGGWLVFFPAGGGRVAATDRETSQSGFADLAYWASGLTHAYLEGALERALALQPEAELARELDRLERLEASAEGRAERLESAASVARAEARLARVERARAEEDLLEAIAEAADSEAAILEREAERSRREADAAERALGTSGKTKGQRRHKDSTP